MVDEVTTISIAEIYVPESGNYRKDSSSPDPGLVDSIKKHGILQPVIVSRTKEGVRLFRLVAGFRRIRAAMEAGLVVIPVCILENNQDSTRAIQITENIQREDPNIVDEYLAFKAMIKKGSSVRKIADSISKSETYVRQRLLLAFLSPFGRDLMRESVLSLSHARYLSKLSLNDQKLVIEHCVIDSSGKKIAKSSEDFRAFIERNLSRDLSSAPFSTSKKSLPGGACNLCLKRSGHNMELFPDQDQPDQCYDSKCYASKVKHHLQQERIKLREQGYIVVDLSMDSFVGTRKGLYSLHSINVSKEPTGRVGLVVDGHHVGRHFYLGESHHETRNVKDRSRSIDERSIVSKCEELALRVYEHGAESVDRRSVRRLKLYQLYSSMDSISQRKLAELFNWKLITNSVDQRFDAANAKEFFEYNTRVIDDELFDKIEAIICIFLFMHKPDRRLQSAFEGFSIPEK